MTSIKWQRRALHRPFAPEDTPLSMSLHLSPYWHTFSPAGLWRGPVSLQACLPEGKTEKVSASWAEIILGCWNELEFLFSAAVWQTWFLSMAQKLQTDKSHQGNRAAPWEKRGANSLVWILMIESLRPGRSTNFFLHVVGGGRWLQWLTSSIHRTSETLQRDICLRAWALSALQEFIS